MKNLIELNIQLTTTNALLERIALALEEVVARERPVEPRAETRQATIEHLHQISNADRWREERRRWDEAGITEDEVEVMGRVL